MIGSGNEGYELSPATRVLQGSPQCGPFRLRSTRMFVSQVEEVRLIIHGVLSFARL